MHSTFARFTLSPGVESLRLGDGGSQIQPPTALSGQPPGITQTSQSTKTWALRGASILSSPHILKAGITVLILTVQMRKLSIREAALPQSSQHLYPECFTSSVPSIPTPQIGLGPEPLGAQLQALMEEGSCFLGSSAKGYKRQSWCLRASSVHPGADIASLQGPLPAKALHLVVALTFIKLLLVLSRNPLPCQAHSSPLLPQSPSQLCFRELHTIGLSSMQQPSKYLKTILWPFSLKHRRDLRDPKFSCWLHSGLPVS